MLNSKEYYVRINRLDTFRKIVMSKNTDFYIKSSGKYCMAHVIELEKDLACLESCDAVILIHDNNAFVNDLGFPEKFVITSGKTVIANVKRLE